MRCGFGYIEASLVVSHIVGFLMWGAFSDERTGLSFTFAAGPRQRRHFCVRVPWNAVIY
jgi:hypothetical protein